MNRKQFLAIAPSGARLLLTETLREYPIAKLAKQFEKCYCCKLTQVQTSLIQGFLFAGVKALPKFTAYFTSDEVNPSPTLILKGWDGSMCLINWQSAVYLPFRYSRLRLSLAIAIHRLQVIGYSLG